MSELCLIVAAARNGVIGRENTLPWRLREDMRHFKATTLGCPVIMGRKTWDSLGRALPGRTNVVITRQNGLVCEGARIAHSLDEALGFCADAARVFVIGGAQLYAEALPRADRLFISEILADVEGDACFPSLAGQPFKEAARRHVEADEFNDHPFDIVEFERASAA
jgi:dihydrofolate reductase